MSDRTPLPLPHREAAMMDAPDLIAGRDETSHTERRRRANPRAALAEALLRARQHSAELVGRASRPAPLYATEDH